MSESSSEHDFQHSFQRPCRACGELLEFRRTRSGKWAPINLRTGENHFFDCPERRRFGASMLPPKPEPPAQATFLTDDDAPPRPPKTRAYYDN